MISFKYALFLAIEVCLMPGTGNIAAAHTPRFAAANLVYPSTVQLIFWNYLTTALKNDYVKIINVAG